MGDIIEFKKKVATPNNDEGYQYDLYSNDDDGEYIGSIQVLPITGIAVFYPSTEFYYTAGHMLGIANVMMDIEEGLGDE